MSTETDIRGNLAGFPRRALAVPPGGRSAAVCLCVIPCEPEPEVLLMRRADRGRNPGQWALPGGRVEAGETAVEAALRELAEEVGLVCPGSCVAGLLDDFATDSGFVITPVVVLVPERAPELRPNHEVKSLHLVPLSALLADGVPRWARLPDGTRLLQMPLAEDMTIHAPTGALLYQFREVALLGRPTRVAGLAQPAFTRR
ncbi:NUDIX hydrolase [Phaeacidiphilus oryzae]|uniref:NUDIX hydrolase n=1 Tax=Phaeacidiphilus oryzae TaxID=348818 RepID=UPI000565BB87|nr:CoA pyrophosphatase [Phaeacidiphilus oryzae]